jgi:ATP-dependent DNA ligase
MEVIARKKGIQVRLYSRPSNDLTYRFPLIVDTWARLRSRSPSVRLSDGETVFRHACKLGLEGIVANGETPPIVRAARPIGSR